MTKTDLVDALKEKEGFTEAEAREIVDALFARDGIIPTALSQGEKVTVTGFGTFEARKRKARMGRNPQTGERIRIPASTAVSFRAGKGLKAAVGGVKEEELSGTSIGSSGWTVGRDEEEDSEDTGTDSGGPGVAEDETE